MKTIKIIDLLNKIANGEQLPKKFSYIDEDDVKYIFELAEDNDYWSEELGGHLFESWCAQMILNDEIKIIEEEKKIEKLGYFNLCKSNEVRDLELTYTGVSGTFDEVYEKINELIDAVNELKGKSD